MKVLFVASEVAPWSKTGGLADVASALPIALAKRGHQVRVVSPRYRGLGDGAAPSGPPLPLRFPAFEGTARAVSMEAQGVEQVFIGEPKFFDRAGIYGEHGGEYADNHRRYAFFTCAALAHAQATGFDAEVVHLNDWQTGLAPLMLRRGFQGSALGRARTVLTIHNLAYQGNAEKHAMNELGLPWDLFTPAGVEFYDRLSFLKAGLMYCDAITTVSPTYAEEIQTAGGGHGLDGVLRDRVSVLSGILNGVDTEQWNPATDPLIPARYSAGALDGKEECRRALLRRFGLPLEPRWPVFGVVGRMADQKGVDLYQAVLPKLLEGPVRAVVMGTGDKRFENAYLELERRFRDRFAVQVGFDEPLSHLIEAGSDFFVMPSRFEPCGLNQMYSLRYGTVPVVRSVGGLKDTVTDLKEPQATGIRFDAFTPEALLEALQRAVKLFGAPRELEQVRARGMAKDFSWDAAAQKYEQVYRR
ncbi:MAG: glycogen synthase GlgA [Myxococcaceae bacterium]